jgi:integrase
LKFSALTFCRPGEIRKGEWKEVDFEKAQWNLSAEKMKMKRLHIVPLSRQAVKILTELKTPTGSQEWLFPSPRRDGRCMSENGVRVALRAMGYEKEDMTAHGFRGMASTILNEHGFMPDIIERQLSHIDKNAIRSAYNHAEYLSQRREMMQWWADWLDDPK